MNDNPTPQTKGELIEQRLDRGAAGAITISSAAGGISFNNMIEVMEFAKLMSLSREAVPQHLRNNPGMCLAVSIQAAEWRMSPFAVANKSYVVNDRIAWESQLVHAVIEQRAPIVGRLRHRFEGEDQERICIVTGHVRGEVEPLEYRSPPIGQIKPKNSPLWFVKPDLQLYYNTVRDFARVYFPDVLMGVYSKDEMEDAPERRAIDVTDNGLHDRLAAAAGQEGFKPGVVDAGLDQAAGTHPPADETPGGHAAGQPHEPATPGGSRKGRKKAVKEPAGEPAAESHPSAPPPQENAQAPAADQEGAGLVQAEPMGRAAPAAKPPKTPAEYLAYARTWLAAATSAEEVDTRWKKERGLRNEVGLTSDERAPLEAEKKTRMAQLGGQ